MSRRVEVASKKQRKNESVGVSSKIGQLLLPLVLGAEATKRGLQQFVYEVGMSAALELFAHDAQTLVGPKGKHNTDRAYNHWGSTKTPFPFGGREVVLKRPRVRQTGGGEVALPTVEAFLSEDMLPDYVMERILLGVSTRSYARSLDPMPAKDVATRRTSKSATSRAFVEATSAKAAEFMSRPLDELSIVAMFIDGIEIGGQSVIIALGVTKEGAKVPLGLTAGTTENAAITMDLVQGLASRGLRVDGPMLFVIDGGKGIRKALSSVFGDRAVVQRCQVHKMRNVRDRLSKSRHGYVMRQMREAYGSASAKTAKKLLQQLISWLENNDEEAAAASLREGLDETLTCLSLQLPGALKRTFSTTNPIENMNGTIRRVGRNVKRWRGGSMIVRWVAAGILEAQRRFRRVKGHRNMAKLVDALAALQPQIVSELAARKKVA